MSTTGVVELGVNIPPSTLQGRLRDAREWRGIEQSDLAKELGIGRSTVSNYERGVTVPGKLVVNAWAVVCDVDVEWLKTGHGHDETPHPKLGEGLENTAAIHYMRQASANQPIPLRRAA